jgi:hypothetical protein
MAHSLAQENPKIRVEYGPYTLRVRPKHAARIAEVINAWSCVYFDLAMMFAHLLGSEGELAIQLFRSIQNERTQHQMLEDAARERLKGRERTICLRIVALAKAARKTRNAYAHGIWGHSDDLPDKILRVGADDWLRGLAGVPTRAAKIGRGEIVGLLGPSLAPSSVRVLSERDMERDLERVLAPLKYTRVFWLIRDGRLLGFGGKMPRRARARVMRQLLGAPDLQAVDRQSPKGRPRRAPRSHP